MTFYQALPWHDGETSIKKAMQAPLDDNPTIPGLSPQLANHLQVTPLLAVGTLDSDGRPWTTIWGGEAGFARPLAQGIVGIRTPVPGQHDPVVERLVGKEATGGIVREEGEGRMVSGLSINLESRKRVKFFGRMVAGALGTKKPDNEGGDSGTTQGSIPEIQLVLRIEQSLGNCPKYLNKKQTTPFPPPLNPTLIPANSPTHSAHLPSEALALLTRADLFFISSSNAQNDMDTNHRGGPPGFLRLASNAPTGAILLYPEYSGNRLYQTLGNLHTTPLAGLCIPDFTTGDCLYLTGNARILIADEAARALPRSNLAVEITVTHSRFVRGSLPFRGTHGENSPYNPLVRLLAAETPKTPIAPQQPQMTATLLHKKTLTPTISRLTFALTQPPESKLQIRAGQYATFSFAQHLDLGYQHMDPTSPRSLNDDFVRTFTVSSPPADSPDPVNKLRDLEFDITIRNVGVVTEWLLRQRAGEGVEVGVLGFGGEFAVTQRREEEKKVESILFIAAGIGITPLLPSLDALDFSRLKILWTVRTRDLGLVEDVFERHEGLARRVVVFVTGDMGLEGREAIERVRALGAEVRAKRLGRGDVEECGQGVGRAFVCTGLELRRELVGWLDGLGKEVDFEEFNF